MRLTNRNIPKNHLFIQLIGNVSFFLLKILQALETETAQPSIAAHCVATLSCGIAIQSMEPVHSNACEQSDCRQYNRALSKVRA